MRQQSQKAFPRDNTDRLEIVLVYPSSLSRYGLTVKFGKALGATLAKMFENNRLSAYNLRRLTQGETMTKRYLEMQTRKTKQNKGRVHAIYQETGGNDAETLARLFEDATIRHENGLLGRIDALLAATRQQWFPWFRTALDVSGLQEVREAGDRGFRAEFQDPWACSRDQIGHFLTALGLTLYPEQVNLRQLGLPLRRLVGAPKEMSDLEVALRLMIGHEKEPDPYFADPLVLFKVRRQFSSATSDDVAAFRRALAALGTAPVADLEAARRKLDAIEVGEDRGNSWQDLLLSLMGWHMTVRIQEGDITDGTMAAAWIRSNLEAPEDK
jgi:hypothetical protein